MWVLLPVLLLAHISFSFARAAPSSISSLSFVWFQSLRLLALVECHCHLGTTNPRLRLHHWSNRRAVGRLVAPSRALLVGWGRWRRVDGLVKWVVGEGSGWLNSLSLLVLVSLRSSGSSPAVSCAFEVQAQVRRFVCVSWWLKCFHFLSGGRQHFVSDDSGEKDTHSTGTGRPPSSLSSLTTNI